MKKIKGIQLGAVLAAMLILMATIAVPVVVAETNTGTSSGIIQAAGSGCGCSGGCGSNVTAVQLNGSEANKAIAYALKNETLKNLRSELIAMGYTPETNDAIVTYRVFEGTSSISETILVVIPFKVHDGSQDEVVMVYARTGDSVSVKAIMKNDKIFTLLNEDGTKYIYGTGSALNKPMEILAANETYQNLKIDLAAQGLILNETNAAVVINTRSNIANMSIIAEGVNGSKVTYATIDLNTETVLSVMDPDLYVCLSWCGSCIWSIMRICPTCIAVCSGCVTLVGCIPCFLCAVACRAISIGTCYGCACECGQLC